MIKIIKTRDVKTPVRLGKNAGFDFFVPNDIQHDEILGGFMINSNQSFNIPSGIKVRLPDNNCLIAFNKSGIAVKYNLIVGACVVDENYTGEIHINLMNVGSEPVLIMPGMKLIQFVLIKQEYHNIKICESEEKLYEGFNKKERGNKGFGSSGV